MDSGVGPEGPPLAEGRVGLIAGGGALPFEAARCLGDAGRDLTLVGFEGISDAGLVAPEDRLRLGQVERLLDRMRSRRVTSLLIVGRFDPSIVASPSPFFEPDETARRLFAEAPPEAHVAWMSTVADFLEDEGLPLARQDVLLAPLVAQPGLLAGAPPSPAQRADVRAGRAAVAEQPPHGLGQAVAVKDGEVVARETPEGTDALIRRAGLEVGPGITIVKVARPGQDPRLDLPAIGPETVEVLAEVDGAGLAVEAGATIVIDAEAVGRAADAHGRAVWAFDADDDRGGA